MLLAVYVLRIVLVLGCLCYWNECKWLSDMLFSHKNTDHDDGSFSDVIARYEAIFMHGCQPGRLPRRKKRGSQ